MKKLVLGALLAAAASSTACTSNATDAVVTARWSFTHFAGGAGSCKAGFPTTSIYAQPWDPFTETRGTPIIDKFDCADMQGTTLPLDGVFLVWVQIESDDGLSVYAQSKEIYVDTADGDVTLDFPILDDAGYFFLTWDLVDALNPSHQLTCAQAGITSNGSVETIATIVGTTFMLTDKFTCEDGFGTTSPLLAGTYSVSVDAEEGNLAVGTAPTLVNKKITAPSGLTDLGHILIPID